MKHDTLSCSADNTTSPPCAMMFDTFTPFDLFSSLMRAAAHGAANRGAIMLGANEPASQKFWDSFFCEKENLLGQFFYGAKCPQDKLAAGWR